MPQIVGSADDGDHQTQEGKCPGQREADDGEGAQEQGDDLEENPSAGDVDGGAAEEIGEEAEGEEGRDEETGLRIGQPEILRDERKNHEEGREYPVGGAVPEADDPQIPLAFHAEGRTPRATRLFHCAVSRLVGGGKLASDRRGRAIQPTFARRSRPCLTAPGTLVQSPRPRSIYADANRPTTARGRVAYLNQRVAFDGGGHYARLANRDGSKPHGIRCGPRPR